MSGISTLNNSDILINDISFKEIIERCPSRYQIITVNLAVAHTDEEIKYEGNFFCILTLTSAGVITVKFNEKSNNGITLDGTNHLYTRYKSIFITNTAQSGKTAVILISKDFFYVPTYKVEQISPKTNYIKYGNILIASGTRKIIPTDLPAFDITLYNLTKIHLFNTSTTHDLYYGSDALADNTNAHPLYRASGVYLDFTPHFLDTALHFYAEGADINLRAVLFGTPK